MFDTQCVRGGRCRCVNRSASANIHFFLFSVYVFVRFFILFIAKNAGLGTPFHYASFLRLFFTMKVYNRRAWRGGREIGKAPVRRAVAAGL